MSSKRFEFVVSAKGFDHFEVLERFEDIAKSTSSPEDSGAHIDSSIKAKAYRHLGWLYFYSDNLNRLTLTAGNEKHVEFVAPLQLELKQQPPPPQANQLKQKQINRKSLQLTIEYLTKSAQLDPTQNSTWYLLGRALACKGNSREAFVSYKNSVNNPEANGDTWCSIGILYYQQKQLMDSLQAFICAIQLDRSHYAAWLNLAILYEQDNQLEEAFKCYKTAVRCKLETKRKALKSNQVESSNDKPKEAAVLNSEFDFCGDDSAEFKLLCDRTKLLSSYFNVATDKMKEAIRLSHPHILPVLQDAFSLQIPTELRQKIVNSSQLEQFNIGLGIHCSVGETDATSLISSPPTDAAGLSVVKQVATVNSNRVLTNLTSNTSPSKVQSNIQQQQQQQQQQMNLFENNQLSSSLNNGTMNQQLQRTQQEEALKKDKSIRKVSFLLTRFYKIF